MDQELGCRGFVHYPLVRSIGVVAVCVTSCCWHGSWSLDYISPERSCDVVVRRYETLFCQCQVNRS